MKVALSTHGWGNIYPFQDGGPYHIGTSPFICLENRWTDFSVTETSIMKELINCKVALSTPELGDIYLFQDRGLYHIDISPNQWT